MPASIVDAETRLPIVKSSLEIVRILSATYLQHERFGAAADEIALCCAIFVGQAEVRLMNPTKLAHFAGMPRATVIRKLRELHARGLLDKTAKGYALASHVVNSPEAIQAAETIRRAVIEVAALVSKMDA